MIPKPLHLAHKFLKDVIQSGDTVVDATLGNGHDTLFLAQRVGPTGQVIGFDVQQSAIDATRKRLESSDLLECCQLHHCGHENLATHVPDPIRCAVFNLGYLPGAENEKSLTTQSDTTLCALNAAAEKLLPAGVLTIMCYVGHPGGLEEAQNVLEWAQSLSRENFRVFQYQFLNAPNSPPYLIIVEKVRG